MALAVLPSPDLRRILALPRRDWREGLGGKYGTADQLVAALSTVYRRPGTIGRLRSCQAVGLAELHDFGGLLAPLKVGAGKTLLSLLAPLVCEAERPVLLVPARHREKTVNAWDEYARGWLLPGLDVRGVRDGIRPATYPGAPIIVVESYERISSGSFDRSFLEHLRAAGKLKTEKGVARRTAQAIEAFNAAFSPGQTVIVDGKRVSTTGPAGLEGKPLVHTTIGWVPLEVLEIETNPLEGLHPDLIIADEAHCLANTRAGVTKRVRSALERSAQAGVRVRFAGLSGTITKRSLRDYEHLARWALGPLSPLPAQWSSLQEWSAYLDEGGEVLQRPQPGALVQLVPPERQFQILVDPVSEIRRGFAARLEATPGVVSVRGRGCRASLEIELVRPDIKDPAYQDPLAKFRAEWELPDRRPICDALEYSRHLRELSCGFFYRWTTPAPEKWAEARKAWRRFVNRAIARPGLDTELRVANACARGQIDSEGAYQDWVAIRDTFKPVTEAVWLSDAVLRALLDHVADRPAIVWTQHVAALERLGKLSGWPVFGAGRGADLEQFVQRSEHPVIASVNACADGFNLQRRSLSVVLGWPRSGKVSEQLIGRTHRDPTEHDCVRVEAFCATIEAAEDLSAAWRDARYVQDSTANQQKLCFADKIGWHPSID